MCSVSAATLFAPTVTGATLSYGFPGADPVDATNRSVTVVGPTTFNGRSAIETDVSSSSGMNGSFSSETVADYGALTDAGAVEYGTSESSDDSHYFTQTTTTGTYDPALVEYPAELTAGTPYTDNWTEAVTTTVDELGMSSGPATSTVTGSHTVTLVSETPQSVSVPAGTFSAYELKVVDVNADGDGQTTTSEQWVAPGVGVVQESVDGDSLGSFELDDASGVAIPSSPSVGLGGSIRESTLPTQAITGAGDRKVVDVEFENPNDAAFKGAETVTIYATPTGLIDAGAVAIGKVAVKLSLRSNASRTVPVAVNATRLPANAYVIVARVTDTATGAVDNDATALAGLDVAAPHVQLAADLGQAPLTLAAGQAIVATLAVTNTGTANSTGPAVITMYLQRFDGTAESVALPNVTRRGVTVRHGGAGVRLNFHIIVPVGTAATTYLLNATFTQGGAAVSAAGSPMTVTG